MEVDFIRIERKKMALDRPNLLVRTPNLSHLETRYLPDRVPQVEEKDLLPTPMEYDLETYEVREIYWLEERPSWVEEPEHHVKRYLVKMDDRALFNELLLINETDLNNYVFVRTKDIERKTKEEIRALSWWKRLFKKF